MKDWQKKLQRDIDLAADEIKENAFVTIVSGDKLIEAPHGVRIVVELSDEAAAIVRYEINTTPRGYLNY